MTRSDLSLLLLAAGAIAIGFTPAAQAQACGAPACVYDPITHTFIPDPNYAAPTVSPSTGGVNTPNGPALGSSASSPTVPNNIYTPPVLPEPTNLPAQDPVTVSIDLDPLTVPETPSVLTAEPEPVNTTSEPVNPTPTNTTPTRTTTPNTATPSPTTPSRSTPNRTTTPRTATATNNREADRTAPNAAAPTSTPAAEQTETQPKSPARVPQLSFANLLPKVLTPGQLAFVAPHNRFWLVTTSLLIVTASAGGAAATQARRVRKFRRTNGAVALLNLRFNLFSNPPETKQRVSTPGAIAIDIKLGMNFHQDLGVQSIKAPNGLVDYQALAASLPQSFTTTTPQTAPPVQVIKSSV